MKNIIVGFALFALTLCLRAQPAMAHGTDIGLTEVQAIEINARYDNGDPMANAQVSIYAPNDAAHPWMTGEADETGHFVFSPDRAIPGQWDVQVRTAGHGDWVYIDVAEGNVAGLRGSSSGLTTPQIVLMSAAVIWGFIGTALYFVRPKNSPTVADEKAALAA